jgi:hypothetical protein
LLTRPVRCFNMIDAMVLVAATALALAFVQHQGLLWFLPRDGIRRARKVTDVPALISSSLIPWTVALLALRLRRPRPSQHRLLVQPGFAACAIVAITIVLLCMDYRHMYWGFYKTFWIIDIKAFVTLNHSNSLSFGPAVLWALMGACGRWRAEPSWIDRAGRALGVLWILLIPYRWFFLY